MAATLGVTPDPERPLSADAVAATLGVTRAYVARVARTLGVGAPPPSASRGAWRFNDADVAALHARNTVAGRRRVAATAPTVE